MPIGTPQVGCRLAGDAIGPGGQNRRFCPILLASDICWTIGEWIYTTALLSGEKGLALCLVMFYKLLFMFRQVPMEEYDQTLTLGRQWLQLKLLLLSLADE